MIRLRFLSLLLIVASSVAYSNIGIDDVFDMISKNSRKPLKFVEIHSATFFTEEIKTTGIVSFSDNGIMSKYIISPKKSEIHIVNNTLSLSDNEGVRRISLSNHPVLANSINATRWLLLGKKDEILNNYSIKYASKANNWSIKLTLIDKEGLSEVPSILITGHLGSIDIVKLIKSNGASITTTFDER